jgi:alcohol dehydrogenase
VHGEAAALHPEEQWIKDITITTGLVDTSSTPTLMRLVTSRQIDARRFITAGGIDTPIIDRIFDTV